MIQCCILLDFLCELWVFCDVSHLDIFKKILVPCTCLCYKSNTNQVMWLYRWDWGSCLYYRWCIHLCDACLLNIMRKWNRGQPAGLQDKNVYSRHLTHDQNVAIILVSIVLDSVHMHWSNKCCLLSTFYMYQWHIIFGINLNPFQIIHFIFCTLVTPWSHLACCCELIMRNVMEVTTPIDRTSSHRSSRQLWCERDVRHLGDLRPCHHSFISIQPLDWFSRNQSPVRRRVWLWHAAS